MKNNMLAWPLAAIVLVTLGFALGRFVPLGPGLTPDPEGDLSSAVEDSGPEILYWVAPMDPDYRRDRPGKSPMGMALVPV